MITKEQALTAREFHYRHGDIEIGPRGGLKYPRVEIWRRNGKTQTWKTRPDSFSIPVKFGLYSYGRITETEAKDFHTSEDCPLRESEKAYFGVNAHEYTQSRDPHSDYPD